MITRRALFSLDFDRPPHAAGTLLRVHRTAMACRVEVALAEEDARDVAAARTATELEISAFCSAIRVGTPLKCGPARAFDSARACIAACETAKKAQTMVPIGTT